MNNRHELDIALRAYEIFSARHPRPVQVTIGQAAQMLGLDRKTVSKIMKTGKLQFNDCGLIPIEQGDRLIVSRSANITHNAA
ncbi:MAG: DNA-binding protein [Burkholderia sp.]